MEVGLWHQMRIISESSVAESEVAKLKNQIATIKSSCVIVRPDEKQLIEKRIETMRELVAKASQIQRELSQIKKDCCSEVDIEKLETDLDAIQTILTKFQPGKMIKILFTTAEWLWSSG
jgi:hypothetical protein